MAPTLSPVLEAARDILRSTKSQTLHVDDIAAAAISANKNMGMTADEFSRKLQVALASHLKLKTQKPVFARVEGKKAGTYRRGWYRLKQERVQSPLAKIEPPDVTTAFVGRAGEYAVMGELLFWGYNVSLMAVDSGVDVIASKDNRYFNIQVKTATEVAGKFTFSIKKSAFANNDNSSMFYVFLMRKKLSSEYVIVRSSYLQDLLVAGTIGNGPTISLTIAADDKGRRYSLNGNHDISIYVGNFGIIC